MNRLLVLFIIAAASLISAQPGDTLRISSVDEYESSEDSLCTLAISYPKIVDMNDAERQNRINEFIKGKFTGVKDQFNVDSCDSLSRFTVEISHEVKYNSRPFISIVLHHYENTGGAHPNHSATGFNIETADSYVHEFGDIFEETAFDTLAKMIEIEILKTYEGNSLSDAGFFEDKITLTHEQDYYVDNGFVVIQFDPYEIGPYALGSIEIPLMFDDIWPFVKDDLPFDILETDEF
jgi:hypothetical protein